MPELAYIGKIIKTEPIEGADRIHLATAVCGSGGIWRGVTPKDLIAETPVVVFLPDAILPSEEPDYAFMSPHRWRVKQRRFKGVPSEALILPLTGNVGVTLSFNSCGIGDDVTEILQVTKYEKQSLLHFPLEAAGPFPDFLPKTDEPNFQKVLSMFQRLKGYPYFVTLKMDGCSSTAFRYKGEFGVCSRNMQIKDGPNPIRDVAHKYDLEKRLPEGYAIQWETCGPSIQKNPIGLRENEGYAFNVWDIERQCYLDYAPFTFFTTGLMPAVPVITEGNEFDSDPESLQEFAEALTYPNGRAAEGLVVRPQVEIREMFHHEMKRLSFKVINLRYKD
jgi:RNA ligase (TIGR02306 family)